MKKKNQKNKNQKQELKFESHFYERVNERFNFPNLEFFKENVLKYCKTYNANNAHSCPHSVVQSKLRNPQYANQRFLVNPKFNIVVVTENHVAFNTLYLDGRDGYGRNISWV
jgi:hypothetical protein